MEVGYRLLAADQIFVEVADEIEVVLVTVDVAEIGLASENKTIN